MADKEISTGEGVTSKQLESLVDSIQILNQNLVATNKQVEENKSDIKELSKQMTGEMENMSSLLSKLWEKLGNEEGEKEKERKTSFSEPNTGENTPNGYHTPYSRSVNDEDDVHREEHPQASAPPPPVYALPPQYIGRVRTEYDGMYAAAVKIAKEMITTKPTEDNIQAWMLTNIQRLRAQFPRLEDRDVILLVNKYLPDPIKRKIESHMLNTKLVDINLVIKLACIGMTKSPVNNRETAKKAFFNYEPKGKQIDDAVADLFELSHCLEMDESERNLAVIDRLIHLTPPSWSDMLQKEMKRAIREKTVDKLDVYKVIEEKLDNVPSMMEFKAYWDKPMGKVKSVNQVGASKSYQKGGNGNQNNTDRNKDKKKANFMDRCKRCKSLKHLENDCHSYGETSTDPCEFCLDWFGSKQYHNTDVCLSKVVLSKN